MLVVISPWSDSTFTQKVLLTDLDESKLQEESCHFELGVNISGERLHLSCLLGIQVEIVSGQSDICGWNSGEKLKM